MQQSLRDEIAALRRQLELNKTAARELDQYPVPYIGLRASGLIWSVNAAAVRFFGRDAQDILNKALHQFAVSGDRIALSRHLRRCELLAHPGDPVQTELTLRVRDRCIPVGLASGSASGPKGQEIFPTAIVDMSEAFVKQQWLALEDRSFHRLLESIDGVVWEAEHPFKLLYVSSQVERVLGYPPEKWMRDPAFWARSIHVDDRERVLRERDTAIRLGGPLVQEYRFHTAKNGIAWVRDSVLVTRTPQGHTRLQGLLVNITPLKHAEMELRRLNGELGRQSEEHRRHLEQTVQSMETFCYGIAHELRAPVRAMRGFADVTLDQLGVSATPQATHHLKRIAAAASYMDELIDDLLAYGRLHHTDLLVLPVRVNNTIGRVLQTLAPRIEKAKAVVRVQPTEERVYAHPMLLGQALENLVANALKFVSAGRTPEIEISARRIEGDRVRITVRDNGVGIDPAYQHKIFGVFQRAHSTDEFPGTGIGLAMVKRIVEVLNGSVGLSSALGEGSTFWIDLPVAKTTVL